MNARLLVGIDGSTPSSAALRWAIGRATIEGPPITLAHVGEPEGGRSGEVGRDEERRGAELLTATARALRAQGIDAGTLQLEGSVAWALASEAGPGDIVVVGTHKTGFLHGRVLGSRSVQIAAMVPGSVAVIPEVDLRFRRGVVAGIDRHESAAAVATAAGAEAHRNGDELHLVQSVADASVDRRDLAIATAIDAVRATFPRLVVRSRVTVRAAAEALLDASRDKALLVLGPGSSSSRSPIGSVLHDVLINVNAPVLVARDHHRFPRDPSAAPGRLASVR
jgi:nucleotide-binding universal stress UspA family protein